MQNSGQVSLGCPPTHARITPTRTITQTLRLLSEVEANQIVLAKDTGVMVGIKKALENSTLPYTAHTRTHGHTHAATATLIL